MLLKKYQLLVVTLFVACVQKSVKTETTNFRETLDLKLKNFITRDSMQINKYRNTKDDTATTIWINKNLKDYLLKTTVNSNSLTPYTITIDKKGSFFTYRYEGFRQYFPFKKGMKKFSFGNFRLNTVNDSIIDAKIDKQSFSFLKTPIDDKHLPNLDNELNKNVLNYKKITSLIDVSNKDTLVIVTNKPIWSDEVYCCTKKNIFKYRLSYSYPVIFKNNISHSKYYLTIYGVLPKEKNYELVLKNKKYELMDLETSKIAYEFMMN